MFAKRLFSGIILLIAAILIVSYGGQLLFLTTLLISLVGLFELYRVLKIEKCAVGIVGYIVAVLYYVILWTGRTEYIMLLFVVFLMTIMSIYVITFPRCQTEQITGAFFGIFYVVIMLSYLYQIRTMNDGKYLVWLVFLSSWGSDTCAYCVGMLIGKHKIAPVLSPKKSIEGCIGGIVGAAVLGFVFGGFFSEKIVAIVNPAVICAIACGIAAVISQIGDFAASAIKRNHDVKDYGNLIPGHGGILDRFDSMLFTAPAIFFAVSLLLNIF